MLISDRYFIGSLLPTVYCLFSTAYWYWYWYWYWYSWCGDSWNRTSDTRIFSPLLYQLSYVTIIESAFLNSNCTFSKKVGKPT
jgi:hypothetical protein